MGAAVLQSDDDMRHKMLPCFYERQRLNELAYYELWKKENDINIGFPMCSNDGSCL